MRFFFECVTCCNMTTSSTEEEEEPSSPATPRAEEETDSLVTTIRRRRRKRTPTRGSSADWKPSLFAIAEDNAVSGAPQKSCNRKPVTSVGGSPRNVKRCGPSSLQVNSDRTRPHDFGREPLPMVFPAFTGSPFMF